MSPGAFSADDGAVAPAVFEPEHFDDVDDWAAQPEPDAEQNAEQGAEDEGTVLVPTAEFSSVGDEAEIQFRRTDTGQLALPIYTSVESLVACCGEEQPWLAVTLDSLPEIVSTAGADGIVQDLPLPEISGNERGGN
ncbi:hypothetical protein GIY23_05980 [Allosaccharopolyspora coralli]|uniref:SseB protein N-terminal domain-containing protein n=1 Tax=Allosaccharopolyspora coralli TaxID=2665642 RepID=A0A5Q3Q7J8_9PSEU|nr:SAV_915 family protein [Allosaccharopolyspora coralli]QGK69144.1 hypothetical protein GIY23_05980 [Allosaccharopolyspora coralli]